ncbi:hypothetical protein [Natrinema longum]|uniref:Uncharacterized protein n=1 Tax=Natrinema longum TaxID=370324 RepID=A0A8A2U534_9EURY|nr:hypothetical protein [Natrinema longum]MBZ6494854.1 hypothetical protein [Natrinema longum]QSW83846.1 hypothetical protein J0X27_10180 [Natrinema longum]
MEVSITGEDDVAVGLCVIDNDGVEHLIELERDGEIYYHDQDGYPDDPTDRTEEGNERVNQARRFAKYFVLAERGYDTVPAAENPIRINAVRKAINEMTADEFERHFGDLYQQLAYEEGNATSPAITVPPEATDSSIFCQNIYLGVDPFETDIGGQLADEYGLAIDQSAANIDLTDVSADELDTWAEYAGEFTGRVEETDLDLSEATYIDETSQLYIKYPNGPNLTAVDDHLEPAARDADTVIELLPIDPQDLEYFKSFMDHYLRCQIRDSFVEMGVHPPDEFQVIGMGRFMSTWRYDNIEFYPEFHNPDAEAFH